MNRTIHAIIQGSPEWAAHRAGCYNASDLAAAMGLSSYESRSALIKRLATGVTPEIDAYTQKRFDEGHRAEMLARPLAERIVGQELFPITMSMQVEGLSKPLSASLDGATSDGSVNWEHKLMNRDLCDALRDGIIPEQYHPQLEQGMLISGATRVLFMATEIDGDVTIDMRYAWYESQPDLRAKIVAIWKQLEADVAAYQHVEVLPPPVAEPIRDLPALTVQISGQVVASNLAEWKHAVLERISEINSDLRTDQDFAIAESTVKLLDEGEKRIDFVKAQAQAQASDIDTVFRAMDEIKAMMRAKRLELDKLVKARKESIRVEIVQGGQRALAQHVGALAAQLGLPGLPVQADFAGAIKGKRTIESMQNAVDALLAAKKIEAYQIAETARANIAVDVSAHRFLFHDYYTLVLKPQEDFRAIVDRRITEHERAVAEREAQRKAAIEREARIKAEREAQARLEAERAALAKAKAEAEAAEREARAKIEAERAELARAKEKAKAEREAQARLEAERAALAKAKTDEREAPPTAGPPQTAEDTYEPVIKAYLSSREWEPGEAAKARAIIVEFIEFWEGN